MANTFTIPFLHIAGPRASKEIRVVIDWGSGIVHKHPYDSKFSFCLRPHVMQQLAYVITRFSCLGRT